MFDIGETIELGLLYAYVHTPFVNEHRYTLQHMVDLGRLLAIDWTHRARFEYRTLENVNNDASRFRSLFKAETHRSGKKWNFLFYNEAFINLTNESWTGGQIFERNRTYLGMKHEFHHFIAELGYMQQVIMREKFEIREQLLVFYIHL